MTGKVSSCAFLILENCVLNCFSVWMFCLIFSIFDLFNYYFLIRFVFLPTLQLQQSSRNFIEEPQALFIPKSNTPSFAVSAPKLFTSWYVSVDKWFQTRSDETGMSLEFVKHWKTFSNLNTIISISDIVALVALINHFRLWKFVCTMIFILNTTYQIINRIRPCKSLKSYPLSSSNSKSSLNCTFVVQNVAMWFLGCLVVKQRLVFSWST